MNDDLKAMQELTEECWAPGSRWHSGELTWARLQHTGREADWPTRVWPRAWGWVDLPGSLYLQALDSGAVGEVLAWAEEVATGPLSVTVLDRERHLVEGLRRNGYTESTVDGPFFVRLVGGLDDLAPVALPEGFTVAPAEDVAARVDVHRAAFHPSRVTVASYEQVRADRLYRPELDLVVHAPDGTVAAYCLAWLDSRGRVGVLEPVGTDPRFRRLGLARAVCLAALHELRELGADTVTVAPRGDEAYPVPRRLYEGLGMRPVGRTRVFGRQC